jgi:hypothetical protein
MSWLSASHNSYIRSLVSHPVYIQYVTKPGNFFGQTNPFLPASRRPTVDRSLVASGAQRQGLQTCRPDAHQPEWLFSRCRLRKYSAW